MGTGGAGSGGRLRGAGSGGRSGVRRGDENSGGSAVSRSFGVGAGGLDSGEAGGLK